MPLFSIFDLKRSTSYIINNSLHKFLKNNNKKKLANFHEIELFFLDIYNNIKKSVYYNLLSKTPIFRQIKYILQKMNYDVYIDFFDNFDENMYISNIITIHKLFNQLYLFYKIDKHLFTRQIVLNKYLNSHKKNNFIYK